MVAVTVEPNKKDFKQLVKYLRSVFPGCQVVMFSDPKDATRYIQDNPIDVLYTEISMLGMTGFDLQEAVETAQPAVLTVFVTSTDACAAQAIKTRATGYILKPITGTSVREVLSETKFSTNKVTCQSQKCKTGEMS